MLKNYLKIAWRNIIRHKMHTTINVVGLALGLTCCLFIFLWVQDERGIDNFHRNGKDLYSLYQTVTADGKVTGGYSTPVRLVNGQNVFPLEDLTAALPEVQRLSFYATGYELPWGHPESFQVDEKIVRLNGSRAGGDFFRMFSFPLLAGSPESALQGIHSIAISRKMAGLFFESPAAAIGKTVRYENRLDFVVSAVFEDVPVQSSLQFDFLFPWETQKTHQLEYSAIEIETYIQLSPGADVRETEKKINQFLATRQDAVKGVKTRVGLQPFGERYLRDGFVNGRPVEGRIAYVRLFSGIAIFILLIACINFMNLATARSVKRAKEVGLRKVVGSTRGPLIGQFLSEAMLFAFLAMLVSILLLVLLLPAFNAFTGKEIVSPLSHPSFWFSLFGLVFITGLVAGSYPAFYLSSLQPIRILKGVVRFTRGAVWFRKGLTVFQFVLSIVLIIATLVITRQIRYVQNTRLGYNRENLIYVRIDGDLIKENKYLAFKQRVSGLPGIALIDRSTEAPHQMNFVAARDAINWEGKDVNATVGVKPASVGYDFVRIMGLEIVKGRDFSRLNPTDSADAFLVNEEAVRQMGLKDPIGKWVSAWKKKGHIIGVLKDYHTQSLRESILPVLLDVKEYENFGVILVRTRPGQTREALASLEKVYKEVNPGYAFTYQFVDEEYKKMYTSEQIVSKLSVLFATLAILISCLGLLGLVMFAAVQRTREIGIRKVLGASLGQIIGLFSQDFLQLVFIAFLIAAPLAWYSMNHWLDNFAYRVGLSWWIFALAGGAAIFIALLTVSYQAVRSAMASPVKALKAE
ncbi:MAG TPA: ABC transporter permease [Puia sp.]|jgi:ABC-type antimicrobial peptide transport system permease subunit